MSRQEPKLGDIFTARGDDWLCVAGPVPLDRYVHAVKGCRIEELIVSPRNRRKVIDIKTAVEGEWVTMHEVRAIRPKDAYLVENSGKQQTARSTGGGV